jgi:hypothetical protein
MAFDIVPHVRVTGLTPKDEVLAKRAKSVVALASAFRKLSASEQLTLGNEAVTLFGSGCKAMPEDLKSNVFNALRKGAPSYVPEKNANIELGGYCLLATVSAVANVERDAMRSIIPLAGALYSGAGFLSPIKDTKLEALRQEAVQLSGDILHTRSETARLRFKAPYAAQPTPTAEEDGLPFAKRAAGLLHLSVVNIAANERMNREEIDLLWWALNGRSGIVGRRIADLSPGVAAVAAGLEVAAALTSGPPGDAHRALSERSLPEPDHELTLAQMVDACAEHAASLRAVFSAGAEAIKQHPRIFPLLFAIDGEAGAARLRAAGLDSGRKFSARIWCHRALEEADLVRQVGHGLALPSTKRV